ncbi:DUF4118 domain-containing protein [Anaerolentibacter hominis]|uniref:DUF4118 domain-containing protein n=1 Tax=Anaerolentibacter hominis TaxID=3079009 RepID=UPI0031B8A9A7
MRRLKDGFKTLLLMAGATILSYLFIRITGNTMNTTVFYILAIILVARFTDGYFWGILASVTGVIGVNYYFTYPYMALDFTRSGYPLTFLGMLAISLFTSTLTAHIKRHVRITAMREQRMNQLNDVNRQLLAAESIDQIITLTLRFVREFTNSYVVFYEKEPSASGPVHDSGSENESKDLFSLPSEVAAARFSYDSKTPAGVGTASPLMTECLYLPLLSHEKIWGILGIHCPGREAFSSEIISFLSLTISQVAMALERQHLAEEHHKLAVESEKEKMRSNLLRAISHDLRTPLTSIIGSSATYIENNDYLDQEKRDNLVTQIHEDANWLLHIVENLLTVTRIRQDGARVNKIPEPMEEVVSEAVARTKKRYPDIALKITLPEEFQMVPMDATLVEQVIINLLENAYKYAGCTIPIELQVVYKDGNAWLSVKDYGPGIHAEHPESIFDGSSYSKNRSTDSSKGMGIGLSICKTIINAHGGEISAANHENGSIFTFRLPLS